MIRNKQKWIKRIAVLGAVIAFSIPAYGQTDRNAVEADAREIIVTDKYVDGNVSRVVGITRGRLISSVGLDLVNNGLGIAGLYADILCHEPMSSIRIVLTLQIWDEEHQSWNAVNRQEFEWKAEDLPEGDELTMASISYNIAGLKSGGIYRLRGLYGAYDINGSYNETWNTFTDGMTF